MFSTRQRVRGQGAKLIITWVFLSSKFAFFLCRVFLERKAFIEQRSKKKSKYTFKEYGLKRLYSGYALY